MQSLPPPYRRVRADELAQDIHATALVFLVTLGIVLSEDECVPGAI
jgi:hypothetical protein